MDTSEPEEELKSRPYQSQMEEIAMAKNTIIHLPTGSGKTFIATCLINRFRNALRKPWGEGGKRTFFLVNTIPLVDQQRKVIEKKCAVKTAGYSGEDGVDYWDQEKWNAELKKYQVIVMTAQILADMITHSYIRIEDINLLIFDECHHAVVDHPMRLVMKHFESCPVDKQPRVLGLTATLLNANVTIRKIEETLRELETTFHATIATVNELGEVLNYSTNPNECIETYTITSPTPAAKRAIQLLTELMHIVSLFRLPVLNSNQDVKLRRGERNISVDPKKIVKEVRNMVTAMIMFIEELGVYGGALGILAYNVLCQRLKRNAISVEEEKLYSTVITQSIEARLILLNSMECDDGYQKILKHSSNKVLTLLNILKEYKPADNNATRVTNKFNKSRQPLSAIIFTQQRFTAKILYNLLKDVKEANPEDFGFINHDFIVGFNINPYKNTREQYFFKKNSQKALLRFSKKELNLLIATSVIEEGVDIAQCLLVLKYDPPKEYRSYIQSKGRARSDKSSYVIMTSNIDAPKLYAQYGAFQETERYIQKLLVGNTDDRDAPTSEEICGGLYEDNEIPPYITKYGARLSAVSAISLLNRYCSVLPTDYFTVITPMWIKETMLDRIKGKLQLIKIYMPIACPLKEPIQGIPMKNLKDAKRAAALNTCIKLHEEGELDEFTLLPRRYGVVDFDQPDVKSCFLNWPWDEENDDAENTTDSKKDIPKEGTKKKIRKHKKVFPSCLEGPIVWKSSSITFHLHIIKLKTVFQEPKESRERALYDLLQRDEGFGFLTLRPLPEICDFAMFLTVGEVATSIEMNYAVIELDKALFNLVKRFHFFLFDQVLEVLKKFAVFDGTKNTMFVVPIKASNGYDIDWDVMQTHTEIRPVSVPSFEERRSLNVTKEDYQYHVVSPWYRGTILPSRYIVSNVLEYMTPRSLFGSTTEAYETYADYYSSKYNLDIVGNMSQPLLEVRDISTRMNCLLPRAATIKSLTEKQLKLISQMQGEDKPKGFPEIFVPEFCIKYDFPGVLWYKGSMLPSIIHRVTMLLVAYELRAEIALETKYGQPNLKKGEKWLPIEINLQVAKHSLLSMVEGSAPIASVDRINNPFDEESPRPVKIASMKETIYELQKNKIDKDYPWDEKMEPIDIERNISSVTVMDIECYDEFVSVVVNIPNEPDPKPSPKRVIKAPAILPPPLKYVDKLAVLSKNLDNRGPELRDILAALTAIKSQDTFNLERVETLGDSFLKFAASLYLFHKFPTLNEGQLTSIKCRLIGNRNLYYAGTKVGLGGRMKLEPHAPRKDFLVPGFFAPKEVQDFIEKHQIRPTFLIAMQVSQTEALSGQLTDESWVAVMKRFAEGTIEKEPINGIQNVMQYYVGLQAVSDKSVADCVEGLIGTYLLSGGIPAAVKILEWLKVLPPKDKFENLLHKKAPTVLTEGKTTAEEIDRIMNDARVDVEEIMKYKFKDPSFLLEALSHPSYIRNRLTRSYERCEFLGDAILDFLITSHIFENCPDLKPGDLTDLRSALVNNVSFAAYLVKLGLHKFICYQLNPPLESAIMNFVEHQERRDHAIVEDVLYLIEEEECKVAEYMEVPKVLSDVFESLIGAIFLDSGGDLKVVWSVVYRIMCREIEDFSRCIPQQPVRVLYEKIHACPFFGDALKTDPDIPKIMIPATVTKNGRQITVYGVGNNTSQAKRAAAKLALKVLAL